MAIEPTLILHAAQIVERLVRRARVRIGLGPFGKIDVTLSTPFDRESVDARLQRIEVARHNLAEALSAMDELKSAAEENKRDLEQLTNAIAKAEKDRADLHAELGALKQIAAIDTQTVREAFRIPTEVDKWKERIWGFIFGALAAALVTLAWELLAKPYIEVHSPKMLHGEQNQPEHKDDTSKPEQPSKNGATKSD
jgi:hypothetical protein